MTSWKVSAVDRVARGIVWLARFVKGWLPRTLGGASALLLLLWGVLGDDLWKPVGWTLLLSGIGAAVLAFLAEIVVQQPSYMELSKLREQAEMNANGKSEALENAIRILLVRLALYCKLTGHSDRFTVYYFYDGEFVRIARHSKNPTHASSGRERYPATQGVIGLAWESPHGQALASMPAGRDSWRRAAKKQGFTDDVIEGMSMRSLALAGYRLETGDRSVGVIVAETTTAHRIDQGHLDTIAASHIVAAIAELVAAFAMMTPAGESIAAAQAAKPAPVWQKVSPRAPIAASR